MTRILVHIRPFRNHGSGFGLGFKLHPRVSEALSSYVKQAQLSKQPRARLALAKSKTEAVVLERALVCMLQY